MPAVTRARPTCIDGDKLDLQALECPLHARFLTLQEREQIHDLQAKGTSVRQIARVLGRAASTVSRELVRNTSPRLVYLPYDAHRRAAARRPRSKQRRLFDNAALRAYVLDGLTARWSPEQISSRLRRDFTEDATMRACPETIYQAVYDRGPQALDRERPEVHLRRRRKARKPQRSATRRTPHFVAPMLPISQRPVEIESCTVQGHGEGDLILGADGRSAMATLVERSSRYLLRSTAARSRTCSATGSSATPWTSG
jgi:IS30 family transposase